MKPLNSNAEVKPPDLLFVGYVYLVAKQSPELIKLDVARGRKNREHESTSALEYDRLGDNFCGHLARRGTCRSCLCVRMRHYLVFNTTIDEILRERNRNAHDLLAAPSCKVIVPSAIATTAVTRQGCFLLRSEPSLIWLKAQRQKSYLSFDAVRALALLKSPSQHWNLAEAKFSHARNVVPSCLPAPKARLRPAWTRWQIMVRSNSARAPAT